MKKYICMAALQYNVQSYIYICLLIDLSSEGFGYVWPNREVQVCKHVPVDLSL